MTELAGILLIEDRELLLLYRSDEEHWEVPGGKVEEEESPTEAAIREAREEIGINVELKKPFYSGEFQHADELFLWHGYIADTEDEPEIQEEKFDRLKYVNANEVDKISLAPNLRQILPALRKVLRKEEE